MAINYSALALPKPEPRKTAKARQRRQQAKARAACRRLRYLLDGGCCVRCGQPLVLDPREARHELAVAHIHEKRPRSLGGSAVDVLNTETLCAKCHGKAHRR